MIKSLKKQSAMATLLHFRRIPLLRHFFLKKLNLVANGGKDQVDFFAMRATEQTNGSVLYSIVPARKIVCVRPMYNRLVFPAILAKPL